MKALVVVQCFPPLLKNAGGVSKRYLTLCRALIDGLGWQVTLLTPVNIKHSREDDVERWMKAGSLVHVPARGVRISSKTDGVAVFLDLISFANAGLILNELCVRRDYDCVFTDDTPWRLVLLLLTRAMGVPTVATTHTDITHMKSFKGTVKLAWYLHMLSTYLCAVHATVSKIFGEKLSRMYGVPVGAVWPPILWSPEFQSEPEAWAEEAAAQRASWLEKLRDQGCCDPKAIMLYAGRWSAEKRIHLLFDAVPKDCALIIAGDSTAMYGKVVSEAGPASGRKNVLAIRKMLSARDLRLAYTAADLFLSASNFETLGNTVVEALCSGTPCAIQPAQGHLEFVKDGENSWFVDYDDTDEARAALTRIVASGLDEKSLEKSIPAFGTVGRKLRGQSFATEFNKAVIEPALVAGRYELGPLEAARRLCAFVACVVVWFAFRVFTRIGFVTLREPEFEVLGPLGGACDDKRAPSVMTFPCLRPFAPAPRQPPEGEAAAAAEASDGSDFATHFEPARKPWWNRRL
mmetsp:Transcript_125417/g.354776  ORF Transcript_125417/g.354776 Transcript_125417/m.354776 type:complete len:519 (-) Transcript_125417:217-1773(-)